VTCPVLLVEGTVTEPWLKRVADVLGERIPEARIVELPGDRAAPSRASTGSCRSSKRICTKGARQLAGLERAQSCRSSARRLVRYGATG
jgi:Ni,Fe-hydrogenase III small subunit